MNERIRILLADDESSLRRTIGQALLAKGYVVDTSRTGAMALEVVKAAEQENDPYDLLITDIRMPVMTGNQLVETLRKEGHELEIMVVTSFAEKDVVLDLVRNGVSDILEKPLTMSEFLIRMEAVVKRIMEKRVLRERAQALEDRAGRLARDVALYKRGMQKLTTLLDDSLDSHKMLLSMPKNVPGIDFQFRMRPLSRLSGNFAGIHRLASGIEILMADVEGQDLETANLTILVKSFFENNLELEASGHNFLRTLNAALSEMQTGRLISAVHAKIDLVGKRCVVTSAAHPNPIVQQVSNACQNMSKSRWGDHLGLAPDLSLESWSFPVESGDRLFFFSDGIEDVSHFEDEPGQELSGVEGLVSFLARTREQPLKGAMDLAWDQFMEHCHFDPVDDLLLLGIEVV